MTIEEGEVCWRCDKEVSVVWYAPDWLWKKVIGLGCDGILCIKCFDKLIREHTDTFLYWSCDTRGFPGLRFGRGKAFSIGLGILWQRMWLRIRQIELKRRLKKNVSETV